MNSKQWVQVFCLLALPTMVSACGASSDRVAQLEARVARLEASSTSAPQSAPAETSTRSTATPSSLFQQEDWFISGGGRDVYRARIDPEVQRHGRAAMLLSPLAHPTGKYGTFMRAVDASPYRGKRVRVSVYTKTEGTTQRADFWARVQAANSPGDGPGLGGGHVELPANSDWARQDLVLDVPEPGSQIQYGVGIAGPGRMWIDEPTLDIVGADVQTTPHFPGEQTVDDWLMTGVGAPDYALSQDGKAVLLDAKLDSTRFVHVLRVVLATPYVGKPVKVSLEVKATGGKSALCVAKVLTAPQWTYGPSLAMGTQQPSEGMSKHFVPCNFSVDVPEGAKWILFGVGTRGAGKLWVRGGAVKAATGVTAM